MLLLYTKLFGYKLTPSEPGIASNQTEFNKFHADAEQESSAKVKSTKLADEIRNVKQAYHYQLRLRDKSNAD